MAAQAPCATTFLYHMRRRVAKLEQGSHLTHGVAWMIAGLRIFCTNFLYSSGHAPSDVPGMLSQCANAGPTERIDSHGLLHGLLSA